MGLNITPQGAVVLDKGTRWCAGRGIRTFRWTRRDLRERRPAAVFRAILALGDAWIVFGKLGFQ